jgi:DNA adenine methylase
MSAHPAAGLKRRERRPEVLLSPLRYPGGKRRLAKYIADALRLNGLGPKLYIEPFAGGASVAIQLLHDNLVEQIALGEKDPMVANFWKAVFEEPERLIDKLYQLKPSLELWEYYRNTRPRTTIGWAIKCIYLNRTSFSGILSTTAGPIGGRRQTSEHDIGCRFPVARLAKRIRQIAAFADRVAFIHEGDWQDVVTRVQALDMHRDDVFYYFDPPFYEKADRLYRYFFAEDDHQQFHDALGQLDARYILSYDAAGPIIAKYSGRDGGPKKVDLLYSVTAKGNLVRASELIVSNLATLPEHARLWGSDRRESVEVEVAAIAD